jgi:hypothetical protein
MRGRRVALKFEVMGLGRSLIGCVGALAVAALLVAGAPPAFSGSPSSRKGVWRPYAPEWDIAAVENGERSLELIYRDNRCLLPVRGLRATVRETGTDVIIGFGGQVLEALRGPRSGQPALCRPPHLIRTSVSLRHRLAGRTIRGREAAVLNDPRAATGLRDSSEIVAVPNLVGFSPRDAAHALLRVGLGVSNRNVGGHAGLPRVVAQGRRPGATVRRGTAVRLSVARE